MTFKNVKTINGRLALHPAEALVLAGFSKDIEAARKTSRNKICDKTYPLKLSQVLGKQRVLVSDLLKAVGLEADQTYAHWNNDEPEAVEKVEKIVRRPGRPRKMESRG